MENIKNNLILGFDVSTKTIGIALFEDKGDSGDLKLLHHVIPKVKPEPNNKMEELFEKARIFEKEFLNDYADVGISKVIIEEPLLQSNNVYTVATLLRFNGMIARSVYETIGIVPEFISSHDARKYAFPQLMSVRKTKKDGTPKNEKELNKSVPTLFGDYNSDADKKMIIWELVCDMEPQITWFYDKKNKLKKENFDMTDSYAAVLGFMRKNGFWK
jgi:RNase H-fold protein (predicted Holliday junction resolvase)